MKDKKKAKSDMREYRLKARKLNDKKSKDKIQEAKAKLEAIEMVKAEHENKKKILSEMSPTLRKAEMTLKK